MRPTPFALVAVVTVVTVVTVVIGGCNRRVFERFETTCESTIQADIEIPTQRAADILIVVDSSGSMAEEQAKLADNFINLREGECPLVDLKDIEARFKNPAPALYEGDGELAKCGFIQLLAAFDNDFRVGVITTDVSPCDNRIDQTPGHGFRPQRGCLQPDGDSRAGSLVLGRADLFDERDDNDDLALRFRSTLENIGTSGSAFERGLDAMEIFLDPEAARAPECSDDLGRFRRDDAQLVVIFLSDEEDCSHADGALGFLDENEGVICGFNDFDAERDNAERCYVGEGLAPIDRYAAALRSADPRAKLAVIAGLVTGPGLEADATPAGCSPGAAGTAPIVDCWESHGSSNFTSVNDPDVAGDGLICSSDPNPADPRTAERAGRPCCIADSGDRYVELARSVGGDDVREFRLDSICEASFRDTMIDIAAFIAATNIIELVEAPAGGVIVVTTIRAGEGEERVVARIDEEACAVEDGFYLEGAKVVFCNAAIPTAGDEVHVRAKGTSDTPACEAATAS